MDELDVLGARARRGLSDHVSAMALTIPAPMVIQHRVKRRRAIRTGVMLTVTAAVFSIPVLASSRRENPDQMLAAENPTTQQPQPSTNAGDPRPAAVPSSSSEQVSVAFSCLEKYRPETLAKRTLAFDGEVISVTPADSVRPGEQRAGDGTVRVEFSVRRWYRGGHDPVASLRTISRAADTSTSVNAIPIVPGARLLVAGSADFAWPCGFTQQWTPEAAAVWEQVFSNEPNGAPATSSGQR